MMFSFACLWSSLTHDLALSNDDLRRRLVGVLVEKESDTYSLGDIIDNNGAVGVAIVHGGQRFISLLASGVPDFEFDRGVLVERYGLRQEGGADC